MMLRAVAGENIDSLCPDGVRKFHVRRVVANHKGPCEVDFVIALCNPQKIGTWLHALAAVSSLMRATVDRPNSRPCFCKTLHDVIIHGTSLFSADLSHGDPALVRHDEKNKIAEAAQS